MIQSDKTMNILITGASRGLGAALASRFARSGARCLYLTSRNEKLLIQLQNAIKTKTPNTEVHVIPADLSTDGGMEKILTTVSQHADSLDILVNNAGMLLNKGFGEIDRDQAMELFRINYLAPAMLIRGMMPMLEKSGRSHVVNISSMGGFQGSVKFPGLSHYSASKAAIAVLTECLAAEYNRSGVVFNCLAIGSVQTEMLSEAFPGYTAPLTASQMAEFVVDFAMNGHRFFNGKILPVALTTP